MNSLDEIDGSFEYREGPPPYLDESVFDEVRIRGFFETVSAHAGELEAPKSGDPQAAQFFWDNPMLPAGAFGDARSQTDGASFWFERV